MHDKTVRSAMWPPVADRANGKVTTSDFQSK